MLCSPVIRALKKARPEAELFFLTKAKYRSLLEFNPHLSGLLLLKDSLHPLMKQIREQQFDLIIDLHASLRSRWISMLSGKPVLTYSKENFAKFLRIFLGINRFSGKHVVERYFDALKPLEIYPDQHGNEFYPCDCEKPEPETELPDFFGREKFAVFAIGGTHNTKKMPVEKWAQLASRMPCPIILIGDAGDDPSAQEIERISQLGKAAIFNACGKFKVGGSAWIIREAAFVISHDTGMMHIASAYRKPVVCIWGNTVPEFGFSPYKTPSCNLQVEGLSCRPCSRTGFNSCPKGHFRCMLEQNLNNNNLWDFIHAALA